jgi:7-carboxy-7-deazaguanine synthase
MSSNFSDRQPDSARLNPLKDLGPDELRISEIFPTLQGETSLSGLPTTFVRTTACDLRCNYCDAAHAFAGGKTMTVDEALVAVELLQIKRVCLTGGEPLLQAALPALAVKLLAAGYEVSCETHGGIDVGLLPAGVRKVVDIKTPGSGEAGTFLDANLKRLGAEDEIKFVLSDRADYEWARELILGPLASSPAPVLLSPVWGRLDGGLLGDWMLADRLNARLQLQLHKILWGEQTRR